MPFVSMDPITFLEGGLINDIDGTITLARWRKHDWKNGAGVDTVVLAADITLPDGTTHKEIWPGPKLFDMQGNPNFAPSMDGDTESDEGVGLIAMGKYDSMSKNDTVTKLFKSLVEHGFDPAALSNVSSLEGGTYHFVRIPAGYKRKNKKTGVDEDATTLGVNEIKSMPGAGGKGGAKAKPAAAAKSASAPASAAPASATPPPNGNGSLVDAHGDAVASALIGVLTAAGKPLSQSDAVIKVFGALNKAKYPAPGPASKLVNDPVWLGSGPWTYDPAAKTLEA